MKPFGYHLTDKHFSARYNLYLRLFGKPFAFEKPKLVLRELAAEKGDFILDIGCRSGELIAELAARGAKAVGLDRNYKIIGEGIPSGNKKRRATFLTAGDARQLPFRKSTFLKISILDCLEHFKEDEGALREIYRVLKPGGTLIITVPTIPGYPPHALFTRLIRFLPDLAFLRVKSTGDIKGKTLAYAADKNDTIVLSQASHEEKLKAFGHYRHYNESTLGRLVSSCGFRVEKNVQVPETI